jgi:hypothetical protein
MRSFLLWKIGVDVLVGTLLVVGVAAAALSIRSAS